MDVRYSHLIRCELSAVPPGALEAMRAMLGLAGKVCDWYIDYTPQGRGTGMMTIATDLTPDQVAERLQQLGCTLRSTVLR